MSKLRSLTQSMNGKLVLLTGVFVLGFVAFSALAINTLNTAKVHGPHYTRVVQNKDLLADVLPPPNYIVETYLVAHLMVSTTDQAELNGLIKHYGNLKAEYADRQAHWEENLEEGALKTEINETSRIPAEKFFAVMDSELIPALKANDQAKAKSILDSSLPDLYGVHRSSVDLIVSTTNQNAAETEAEVAELIGQRHTVMLAVGMFLITGVVGFAYWLSRSVRRQEREMARIRSMMEQLPANIMFADTDLIVQYMNPASEKTLKSIEAHLSVRADEMIGQSIDVFHNDPSREQHHLADPKNLPMQSHIQVGQETVDLLVSSVKDAEGKHIGSMVSWEVITERLKMESQIEQQQERERRLAQQTQEKVDKVLKVVNGVANGRFDVNFPDLGDDAVGRVAKAMNQAVTAVREALTEVREVSTTVSTASNEMSGAAAEISRGAQQQAARLEETAASLDEITTTVRQNSENAKEARALAHNSRDIATQGGDVVGDAVQAMKEINDSSKRISDIITTIDEIAFQTNLLALNAAVEAARAGEQGRGFAVVAGEVRNLAQRSASSAKEIKSLIEDSNSKVEKGTRLVNRSGDTLGEIVESVKRVTDIVSEIAAASEEQLTGIQQVSSAVTQMDEVTQSNASQTEELAGTSTSVLDHAGRLSEMVSSFKLGGEAKKHTGQKAAAPTAEYGYIPKASSNRVAAALEAGTGDSDEFLEF